MTLRVIVLAVAMAACAAVVALNVGFFLGLAYAGGLVPCV